MAKENVQAKSCEPPGASGIRSAATLLDTLAQDDAPSKEYIRCEFQKLGVQLMIGVQFVQVDSVESLVRRRNQKAARKRELHLCAVFLSKRSPTVALVSMLGLSAFFLLGVGIGRVPL